MKRIITLLGMSAILMCSLCGCMRGGRGETQTYDTESILTEEDIQENVHDDEMTATTEDVEDESTEEITDKATEQVGQMADEEYAEYTNMYYEILDSMYQMICAGPEDYDYIDGTNGIGELIMSGDDNVLEQVGFTFEDVNQDGTVELIIGAIYEDDTTYQSQTIYSVYTYKDTPHLVLEGWSRNRCFLLEDGTFYSEGSGGAMYSIFEHIKLDPEATEISYIDYYFSHEKDESFEKIGFYHNQTGDWEVSVSEEMEEDAYWAKAAEYSEKVKTLTFYPFSSYEYTGAHED